MINWKGKEKGNDSFITSIPHSGGETDNIKVQQSNYIHIYSWEATCAGPEGSSPPSLLPPPPPQATSIWKSIASASREVTQLSWLVPTLKLSDPYEKPSMPVARHTSFGSELHKLCPCGADSRAMEGKQTLKA